jgi:capsule polysaccharide export protein KpsE/RkpR
MNRWRSPLAGAKRAEREKIKCERMLKERRRARTKIIVLLLLSFTAFLADRIWHHSTLVNRSERKRQHGAEATRSKASQAATNTDEKAQSR